MKRYILLKQLLLPAFINLTLNGLICWLVLKNTSVITFWGKSSIGIDLLITAFLIPFITSLINSYVIAEQVVNGKLEPMNMRSNQVTGWLLRPTYLKSTFLGLICIAFAGLPTIIVLQMIWNDPISLWNYVLFKSLWAAVLAAIVSPLIAIWAIQKGSYLITDSTQNT